ncbi:MAG TPA: NADAR family protein [Mycobacterium sp.]|nr:NADAR family protein [Mycobacterium sp.]
MSALHMPVIDSFAGEYLFLSNFAPAPTPHRGWLYPTSEHAFAASKTRDEAAIAAIRETNDPARAKQIGRAAPLVDGWESGGKFTAMEEVVSAKFDHNTDLARRLLATEGSLLVEGNTWHDQVWGSCRCDEHCDIPGANALGIILMAVRLRLVARGGGGAA